MKGLGKRILMMAAVTAVCVWAAGKSGYAVKPYRLDEDTLAQQVQAFAEQDPTEFYGRTIYDGIVIGDRAFYVFTQQAGYVSMKDGVQWDCFFGDLHASSNWVGDWTIEVGSYSVDAKFGYEVIGCGGHNFLLLFLMQWPQIRFLSCQGYFPQAWKSHHTLRLLSQMQVRFRRRFQDLLPVR